MGLMRALQGVATGYLSGEVDRMAAIKKHKLDMQKKRDAIKAQEASSIAIQDAELDKRATIRAEEEETDKKDRMQRLLAMGYTEEYVRTQMPSALLDDNLLVQLDIANQGRWGDNKNWKTIKLAHGPKWAIGMTPMEYELELFKKSKNKNNIKSTIKDTNNISDNVSNVVFEETDTLSQVKTEEEPYNWSNNELLYGKKTAAIKRGNSWISPDGVTILVGYQDEKIPGSNVYNPEYVTVGDKNGEPKHILVSQLISDGWIDSTSKEGIAREQRANPELSATKYGQSYMIQFADDNSYYRVDTITQEFTGGKKPETRVSSVDPKLAKKLGLKSDMTFPIEDEQKGVDYIPFNITIDDLKTLGRTQNFNVFEYDKGDYVESRKIPIISSPERIKSGSASMSRIEKSGLELVFGKEAFDFRESISDASGERVFEFSILGDDKNLSAATNGYRFVLSDAYSILTRQELIRDDKGNVIGRIPEDMKILLELPTNNPVYLKAEDIRDGTAKLFKNVRQDLVADYREKLKDGQDFSEDMKDFGITSSEPGIIAQQLADADMGSIESLMDLMLGKQRIDASKLRQEKSQKESREQIISNYFPGANIGQDFREFVINNITQEDLENNTFPELRTAIDNLVDPGTTNNKILKEEVVSIIDEIRADDTSIIKPKETLDQKIKRRKTEQEIKDLFNVPFPPLGGAGIDPSGAKQKLIDKWTNTHSENWNKILDYINEQKPEVEQIEKTRTLKNIPQSYMEDTPEFKKWKKKYKKYLDIGYK